MVNYINRVLILSFQMTQRKLLIMDSCSAHLVQRVKDTLHNNNSDIVIIPGGCTEDYQPLGLTVNRKFISQLRKWWMSSMSSYDVAPSPSDHLANLIEQEKDSLPIISRECIQKGVDRMLKEANVCLWRDKWTITFQRIQLYMICLKLAISAQLSLFSYVQMSNNVKNIYINIYTRKIISSLECCSKTYSCSI